MSTAPLAMNPWAARRAGGASLLLAAIAILVPLIPGATAALQYERGAIGHGELWRLITCHWTHWSLDHLLWDVVVFASLGLACERVDRRQFILTTFVSAIVIMWGVWLFVPDMTLYRGLSGIDCALFVFLMLRFIRQPGVAAKGAWAMLLLFASKLAYEALRGATLFVDAAASGFDPVPLAHALGAVAGVGVELARRANTPGPAGRPITWSAP